MSQTTFAWRVSESKKKLVWHEWFLREMGQVVLLERLLRANAPHHPRAGNSRQLKPLVTMLHMYYLHRWLSLSDPASKNSLYANESMYRLTGIGLDRDTS